MDNHNSYYIDRQYVETQENSQPIGMTARDCADLFQKCLDRYSISEKSAIATETYYLVQEYKDRFDAWISFLGVFAGKNVCLDHRLRNHQALQDMIIRLLVVLRRNLYLIYVQKRATEPADDFGDHVMADALTPTFDVAISGIKDSITHLNKLGIAIRSSSRSTITARARRFVLQHPSLSRFSEFEDKAYLTLDSIYPNAPISLRHQLVDTMTDRYARLQYENIRNDTIRNEAASRNSDQPLARQPEKRSTSSVENTSHLVDGNDNLKIDIEREQYNTIDIPASSIDTNMLFSNLPAAARTKPSIKPSKTATAPPARHREPPTPKFEDGKSYTTCEWCFQVIDRSVINMKQDGSIEWSDNGRRHYRHDLQPYVCISEECAKLRPTYSSSSDWSKHMISAHSERWMQKIHSQLSWVCKLDHENNALYMFTSQDELQNHIVLQHANCSYSMEDFYNLSDHSMVVQSPRPEYSCPLCLFSIETESDLDQKSYERSEAWDSQETELVHSASRPHEKRIKLSGSSESSRNLTSRSMDAHIADHLHYLMVVSIQLISIMKIPSSDSDEAWSDLPTKSHGISEPGGYHFEREMSDLAGELQGSIIWSDVDDMVPEALEFGEQDWSAVRENTQGLSNEKGETDPILEHFWTLQKLNPLSRIDFSKNARFNSKYREHAKVCHENTRTELLQGIYDWVDREDERHIFWLQGLAGSGKSTIAQTVAKHYYDLNPKRLAASFFFARGGGDASHAGLFATSIAIQLANNVPLLRDAVCKAITKCSDIEIRPLSDQWRRLVLQPFSDLEVTHTPSSYLIVIDALDECNGENDIQIILQLLSEAQQLKPLRLRFLLTSRPDTVIRHGFQKIPMITRRDTVLHEIAPAIVDHDIALYLAQELAVIGREQHLGSDWPAQWQVQQLVGQSSGLFIWAATACRYIREGRSHANERLSKVLEIQTGDSALEKELDAIYTMVLMDSVPEDLSDEEKGISYGLLNYILGSVVALFTPLSIEALHLLLNFSIDEITRTVIDLHSILHIPRDEEDELRLHHPSFRDYLVNPTRCGIKSLQVDEKGAHRRVFLNCIRLMTDTLKENICDLNYSYPGILLAEVEEKHIQQCIQPALRYACLHWVQHLQKSREMVYDKDPVDNFMRQHLLSWLEALSWMGKASESIQAVTYLQSITSTKTCPLFCQYIQDIKRFISYSLPIMERAPLQLYLSALIFTPESSHVRSHFQQRVFRWMKKLPVAMKNWSSLLQALEGHTGRVNAIAFSPDGTMLASASDDDTVRLWDTATGSARQTLEGHTSRVNAIAFSPDGTILASASDDRIVRFWDTATGNIYQTLKGHTDLVNAIAFSPDGTILASASDDRIVRLWDTATGNTHQTLEGHTGRVNAIAFSPDRTILALASNNCTVQLWDIATASVRQTLEGHTSSVRAITFSLDGTILASASDDRIVRLWDIATASVRQTLEGHTGSVNAIAFSPDGTMLITDRGRIHVNSNDVTSHSQSQHLVPAPEVVIENPWIVCNGHNILWLPPEYRSNVSAVYATKVAIGCSSGQVLLFELDIS